MPVLSLEYFEKREKTVYDWIIPGLLTRGNTAFMMGPSKKACKSWLVLAAAWNLGEGLAPWGLQKLKPAKAMRTVYFTQEDTEDNITDRVKNHIINGGRKSSDKVWIVPKNLNIKLDTADGRKLIKEALDEVREEAGDIDLVCFDPMRRIHGGDENDSSVIARLWETIEGIHNDYNCGVLITHHIRKPPNDMKNWDPSDPYVGRGSGDIYGGGDAFIMVVPGVLKRREQTRRVTTYFESKRAAEMAPTELMVNFNTGQVDFIKEVDNEVEEDVSEL